MPRLPPGTIFRKPLLPDDERHGKITGYRAHHDQGLLPVCEPCRLAWVAYCRRGRPYKVTRNTPLTDDDDRHGTYDGYRAHVHQRLMPACEPCMEAMRERSREQKGSRPRNSEFDMSTYLKRREERFLREGWCPQHKWEDQVPVMPGKKTCEYHFLKSQTEWRERAARLTAEGLCNRCGKNPARPGLKSCQACVEQQSANGRPRRRAKVYGMTEDVFQQMWADQNGLCAICDRPLAWANNTHAVDHDHDLNKVRGLLCMPCNTALGGFQDSAILLRRAADYLDKHAYQRPTINLAAAFGARKDPETSARPPETGETGNEETGEPG